MRRIGLSYGMATLLLAGGLLAVGCVERENLTEVDEAEIADGARTTRGLVAALDCTADVAEAKLTCERAERLRGYLDPHFLTVGDPFVSLTSSAVNYDAVSEIFSANVTVTNATGQQLGTPDEVTTTNVRVFFHTGPDVVSGGPVSVANADGTGDFTGVGQPFHEYEEIIVDGGTSLPKNWQWNAADPSVFTFSVFVEADVPHPNGFVNVTPTNGFLSGPGGGVSLSASAFDHVGRPVARTFTWDTSDPLVATVDAAGNVTAQGGGRAEILAMSSGSEADGIAVITVNEADYQIELRFLTAITSTQRTAFENARDRWEAIITSDLSAILLDTGGMPSCGGGPIDEVVDDMVINVVLGPIDGVGMILGAAGPCWVRTANSLPLYGFMIFDTDDLGALEMDNQLEDVILHEMGHAIGIGTIWQALGLLLDDPSAQPADCDDGGTLTDPYFNGPEAIVAFDNAGGTTYTGNKVPAEDMGGSGTRCGHWREDVHEDELMTGIIEAPGTPNPLSLITIESLEDIGYGVDPSQADAYSLPMPFPALAASADGLELVDDIWMGPVFSVDESGNVRQLLPDRRPQWQKDLVDELTR